MNIQIQCLTFLTVASISLFLNGCSVPEDQVKKQDAESASVNQITIPSNSFPRSVVHAINIGGDAYSGIDGIEYAADNLNLPYPKAHSDNIMGSQDSTLFQSFRRGENARFELALPVTQGTYAVTFKFAEPDDIEVGERQFDVILEDQTRIKQLDIRLARDNKVLSELTRTVTDITVTDGMLNILLDAQKNQPLLHAIIVRKEDQDDRNWELVWSDEFNQDGAIDQTKWQFDIWPARKVNSEDQAYTDRAKNARVEDGKLIIEAHKEKYGNAEYTSARIHNKGSGDMLYGKVDVLARIPRGQGTWSAIWMLPSDPYRYSTSCQPNEDWQGSTTCDAWPNSGEIDILEHVGYDMQRVHGTVHTKAYYWINWQQRKASVEGKTVDTEFHLYSMEWTPDYIIISFDNVPYFFYRNEGDGWQSWPFDHPFHLILNLAIGGDWGRAGGPIDDSIFPVKMEVDYVRIYQLGEQQ